MNKRSTVPIRAWLDQGIKCRCSDKVMGFGFTSWRG